MEATASTENKKVGASAFEADETDLFDYEVPNAQTGEPLGKIYLTGFKQPVLDKYRDIRNGDGRRKGDEAKAREFLFTKTYKGFEFIEPGQEIDLSECKSEVEFFLKKCAKVVDATLIRHLAAVFPEVDSKK